MDNQASVIQDLSSSSYLREHTLLDWPSAVYCGYVDRLQGCLMTAVAMQHLLISFHCNWSFLFPFLPTLLYPYLSFSAPISILLPLPVITFSFLPYPIFLPPYLLPLPFHHPFFCPSPSPFPCPSVSPQFVGCI